jgi:hypothetical protein
VVACGSMLATLVVGLFTAVEVFVQKHDLRSVIKRLIDNYEPAVATLLMSLVIGTIVFSFWYWNGLALYRGRQLEEARASLREAEAACGDGSRT